MSEAEAIRSLLQRNGVLRHADARLTPLTGGVSSEIYLVDDGDDRYVIKRALAKLNVPDNWFADINRNATEHRFLEHVARFLPRAVPRVRFSDSANGYFAMEYLGEGFHNWKHLLLEGVFDTAHASDAGEILGLLQRETTLRVEVARDFDTGENFRQLRIDPYLITAAGRHDALRTMLLNEAARLGSAQECLVHGDFSPKNILVHPERMVLVDCEVAWFGDSAFDPAFLLSHLFLKALFHAPQESKLDTMVNTFWDRFLATRGPAGHGRPAIDETRVVRLMLMLMLARVDGKSRVEYLDATKADVVRVFVTRYLMAETVPLKSIAAEWSCFLRTDISQLP